MAVTLKFLSRAPCKQQLLAASPKVLGGFTPKTPARSPLVGSPAACSPAACSPPAFFGKFEGTPLRRLEDTAVLGFGTLPRNGPLRRAVEASAAAAEDARQHFLARRAQRSGQAACAESDGGPSGARLPSLLRQHSKAGAGAAGACEDPQKGDAAAAARACAERAREHFLARQARHGSEHGPDGASGLTVSGLPTLLGRGRTETPALADSPSPAAAARECAERAREHFLASRARRSSEHEPDFARGHGLPTLLSHGRAEVPALPTLLGRKRPSEAPAVADSTPLPGFLGQDTAESDATPRVPTQFGSVSVEVAPVGQRALAEMARQSFLSRQQRIAGRSLAAIQVP